MPFGFVSFEIAQFMPIATKGNPSRINEFADETRNFEASECRLLRGIPRLLPTVHKPTAYYDFRPNYSLEQLLPIRSGLGKSTEISSSTRSYRVAAEVNEGDTMRDSASLRWRLRNSYFPAS